MRRRALPYTACVLFSLLVAVIPCALVFDMASPVQKWEYWYWKGQPNPVPQFRLPDQVPKLLRTEIWLYRVLVTPPAFAAKALGFWPGNYGLTVVSRPGTRSEAFASLPPAALALEHLRRAIPYWLAASLVAYEAAAVTRRRFGRRRVA